MENIHAGGISGGVKGLTLALFHNQLLNPVNSQDLIVNSPL